MYRSKIPSIKSKRQKVDENDQSMSKTVHEEVKSKSIHTFSIAPPSSVLPSLATLNPVSASKDKYANFPVDNDSKTMHLYTKQGEVSNRILICPDQNTAHKYSKYLDSPK